MISNQKIVYFLTAIIVGLAPMIYYLWHNEIMGIGNWGKKKEEDAACPAKDCTTEVNQAIEDHKAKNKIKRQNRGRLGPGPVKVSSYDIGEESHGGPYGLSYGGHEGNVFTMAGGYLTKEEAYPNCMGGRIDEKNGRKFDEWVSHPY